MQSIIRTTGDISKLSRYDIERLRVLGQQIILKIHKVSSIVVMWTKPVGDIIYKILIEG